MSDEIVYTRRYSIEDTVVRESRRQRTIELVAVPFNTPTEVADVPGRPYLEAIADTAFAKQLQQPGAVGRVGLRWSHDDALMHQLGRAVEVAQRPDHLRATFRVFPSDVGDHALAMAEEMGGDLGASIGFRMRQSEERDGVTWRTEAWLEEVSLTPTPAYEQAKVLAVRDGRLVKIEAEVADASPSEAATLSAEVAQALANMGIEIPAGLSVKLELQEPDPPPAASDIQSILDRLAALESGGAA